jgi:hypothetical protein
MTMKINSKDFRVREGDDVNLKKWSTIVDPVYKSKERTARTVVKPAMHSNLMAANARREGSTMILPNGTARRWMIARPERRDVEA